MSVLKDIKLFTNSNRGIKVFTFFNVQSSSEPLSGDFEYSIQMFLKCLFTPIGTDNADKTYGTNLLSLMRGIPNNVNAATTHLNTLIDTALQKTKDYLAVLSVDDPKKLLYDVEVTEVSLPGKLVFSLILKNKYNEVVDMGFNNDN